MSKTLCGTKAETKDLLNSQRVAKTKHLIYSRDMLSTYPNAVEVRLWFFKFERQRFTRTRWDTQKMSLLMLFLLGPQLPEPILGNGRKIRSQLLQQRFG
ncbi:hypothetical protein DUI87_15316 [Hirundo rustica rustica]|uniref:Uncharacterized protein n=1 Tax=Hirundo rustica rustica TaxID=333673 RepID=A0A3M0KKW0_HIRRU|nr:hypothetical protein DUI87_15316 [Hirundo rustica rustica]